MASDIKTGYVLLLLIGLAIMLVSILAIYNIKKSDEGRIHDTLYNKKENTAPALEGDGAIIPPQAEEATSSPVDKE